MARIRTLSCTHFHKTSYHITTHFRSYTFDNVFAAFIYNNKTQADLPIADSCLLSHVPCPVGHDKGVSGVAEIPESNPHVRPTSQKECIAVSHSHMHTIYGMGTSL